MKLNFLPKAIDFDSLFSQQNAKLVAATELLHGLFSDPTDVPEKCRRIYTIEEEANALFRTIATELASTFITSLDREDIHDLNTTQEDVINLTRSIANRFGLYQLGQIWPAAQELVHALMTMAAHTSEMLKFLHARKPVEVHSAAVRRLKDQTDILLLVALGELYESDVSGIPGVVGLVKWSQIFDRIENALVRTEELAGVIEGISLKNA